MCKSQRCSELGLTSIIFLSARTVCFLRQILIENGGATGVEYVQDGEKRIAKLAVGGEVMREKILGKGRETKKVCTRVLCLLLPKPLPTSS